MPWLAFKFRPHLNFVPKGLQVDNIDKWLLLSFSIYPCSPKGRFPPLPRICVSPSFPGEAHKYFVRGAAART